jgi:hypothetical protein
MGRWFVATTLLLLGLVLSGAACAKSTADHWPARVQARAVSAQQSLQRRTTQSETSIEHAGVTPVAALLLFALAFTPRRSQQAPNILARVPRETSLWLLPHLFRPPPAILAH